MTTWKMGLSFSDLPKFSGARGEDFDVFLIRLESILRLLHVPENEHIDVLTLCLNGAALRTVTWERPSTYKGMVDVLYDLVAKLTYYVQVHGEPLSAYYSRTLEQLDRDGILDTELRKTFFVNGLRREIQVLTAVAARGCDVHGAYKAAQEIQSARGNGNASPHTPNAPANVGAEGCWACGDASHLVRRCPARRARKFKKSA